MPDTPLNPDAQTRRDIMAGQIGAWIDEWDDGKADTGHVATHIANRLAENGVTTLALAQTEVTSAVEAFINERPGYITALKNTRGTDDQSDYWRWQGHAESRRQLAQSLGWTVPHNTSETTCPAVNDV